MSGYGWVDRHTDTEIDSQGTRECLRMVGLIDRHTDTEIDSQETRDVWVWMG